MAKVLVADPIAQEGIALLRQHADVDVRPKLGENDLIQIVGDYDALVVRSETRVTARVLEAGNRLRVVGRAGVGVDNIDVEAATGRGILVVNSPHGNTTAAAELTVALMLSLARRIPQADAALRAGVWDRKRFVGTEVYGRTIGIVGLGRIGLEVARRCRAFGMKVIAHDPFANASLAEQHGVTLMALDNVLRSADFISLHVPLTDATKGMIGSRELARMKPGVRIINCARGGIVDERALADAIQSGHVAGAAFDVFSEEPVGPDNPLVQLDAAVVTPHLGASTEQAQVAVALDVAEQVCDVLEGRPARSPVNLPNLPAETYEALKPYLDLGRRMGSLVGQLAVAGGGASGPVEVVDVRYAGDFGDHPTGMITRSVLAGLLTPILSDAVNMVNAPMLAEARGIRVTESSTPSRGEYSALVSVTVGSGTSQRSVSGTAFGRRQQRVVEVDGYEVSFVPDGILLMTTHRDRPGTIGAVGTLLGRNNVNIAGMDVGRKQEGGLALMVLILDDPVAPELLAQIRQVDGMETACIVNLS
ncbi:MAG: phosphoglycerate dehydrogenase [Chthonomonadales bacterium]|nr:phosphoglycerate dehydrogenase [Chthonomonadales bacterium]